jgi:hypothetical protein
MGPLFPSLCVMMQVFSEAAVAFNHHVPLLYIFIVYIFFVFSFFGSLDLIIGFFSPALFLNWQNYYYFVVIIFAQKNQAVLLICFSVLLLLPFVIELILPEIHFFSLYSYKCNEILSP